MILNPATLLILIGLLIAAAIFHTVWWLLGLAALAAWAGFDRWARGAPPGRYLNPATGRELPEIDLGSARAKGYAISDFLGAAVQGERGALLGSYADLGALVAGCADPAKGLPLLEPRKAGVVSALACSCAACGQPFDRSMSQRALAAAIGATPPLMADDALPLIDDDGRCPACRGNRLRYVYDP